MKGRRTFKAALCCAVFFAGPAIFFSGKSNGQQSLAGGSNARFPHGKTEHRKLDCSKCHSVSTAKPEVEDFPGHKACVICHNFAAMIFSPKPVMFCSICHQGRPVSKTQPALFRFPKSNDAAGVKPSIDFGTAFSHVNHLKPLPATLVDRVVLSHAQLAANQKPKCTDCHGRADHPAAGAPEMLVETGHTTCFRCHGENPVKPPNMHQCAECHKIDGPRSPNLFNRIARFKHQDHDYDIRPKRKSELRMPRPDDFLCAECHSAVAAADSVAAIKLPDENQCAKCHNGRLGLPDTLPAEVLRGLRNQ
ncbi:MAG TPA: cytochrome c3 family protein [Blastocatellia bacterium]|nr:cytochrome c3 family protein [Blastocatellia bacterium]